MTIVYPVNGKNERLGSLFQTPKHLLLYKGVPAIKASVEYMKSIFPKARITILSGFDYYYDLLSLVLPAEIVTVPQTNSQVETIQQYFPPNQIMFADCDIIPLHLNKPEGNTVYLFENKTWLKHYSNYLVEDGKVIACNEKGEYYPHAGAGIYYFENAQDFYNNSEGCTSISQVVAKLPFNADTTSTIFRFGTLNDIKNDEQLIDRVY